VIQRVGSRRKGRMRGLDCKKRLKRAIAWTGGEASRGQERKSNSRRRSRRKKSGEKKKGESSWDAMEAEAELKDGGEKGKGRVQAAGDRKERGSIERKTTKK